MLTIADPNAQMIDLVTPEGVHYNLTECVAPPEGVTPAMAGSDEAPIIGGAHFLHVKILTPQGVVDPHFHRMDQWQVLLNGAGKLGKQPIEALSLLYTDGYTPYGPITAGDTGVEYFDLHADNDWGAYYGNAQMMPGHRSRLRHKAGRTFAIKVEDRSRPAERGACRLTKLMEPLDDNTMAWQLRGGPDAQLTGLSPAGTRGLWYFVASGSVSINGQEIPEKRGVFVGPGEAAPQFRAGAAGANILIMAYGLRDETRPVPSTFGGDTAEGEVRAARRFS